MASCHPFDNLAKCTIHLVLHLKFQVLLPLYVVCDNIHISPFSPSDSAFAPMNMENNFGRHDPKFRSHDDSSFASTSMEDKGSRVPTFGNHSDRNSQYDSSFRNELGSNFHNEPSFRNHQYPNFRSQHGTRNQSFDD
jgi:hypothetical protein